VVPELIIGTYVSLINFLLLNGLCSGSDRSVNGKFNLEPRRHPRVFSLQRLALVRKFLSLAALKERIFPAFASYWLTCCVFASALSGCSTPSREFPIGLYDVPPEHFASVAAAGFNTVVGARSKRVLDEALTNRLKIIAIGAIPQPAVIPGLESHPALWGYYLFDEPDMHLVSPASIARLNAGVRRFSRKPTLVVLMSGSAVEKYQNTADVIAVDWYPIPWAPVATVAREMRLARIARHGRPFYAVLQAFNWESFPELLRTEVTLREPTFEEMRCMTYLALGQGASGLLFYTYDNPRWKIYEHPKTWNALCRIAQEIRRTSPIFQQRVDWWPAETQFHGPPAEMYNEIMEARVLLTLHHVKKAAGTTRPGYYLVAVNTSGAPSDFSFKLPFGEVEPFDASCGSNEFAVDGEWVRKTYSPFEVCVFGPIHGRLNGGRQ
jgi:hypothetical protein